MGPAFVSPQPPSSPTSSAQRLHLLVSNCSSVKRCSYYVLGWAIQKIKANHIHEVLRLMFGRDIAFKEFSKP